MNIIQKLMTKNDCYVSGRTIAIKGLMLHSVGCNQPSAMVFINQWNKPASQQGGRQVCVHGFIEPNGTVYQTLPWNRRGWHGGGSSNNTHIGVEMTEPATIRYTGGSSWTDRNPEATKAHVLGTYKTAVELFAHLCKYYKLNPLADGVIVSHKEGCARGIASNHGDPEHMWVKYGLTMNQFRKDVAAEMNGAATPPAVDPPKPSTPTTLNVGDIVTFAGGNVYKSSDALTAATTAPVSRCKITATSKGRHPFHCISEDGKGVYGWVDASAIRGTATEPPKIAVGSTVRIVGTRYTTGQVVPDWVKATTHTVSRIDGAKALLGATGGICSWVNLFDLTTA